MEKKLSDVILESGDDFQVDAMEDFDERMESGEFANKSVEEIRDIYYQEALVEEESAEMDQHFREMNEREEAEDDERDFHITIDEDEEEEDDFVEEDPDDLGGDDDQG